MKYIKNKIKKNEIIRKALNKAYDENFIQEKIDNKTDATMMHLRSKNYTVEVKVNTL